MLNERTLIETLRLLVRTVAVLALLAFAVGDKTAAADSLSDKWLSPAPSAAKKNPIAPTQDSISAGQKIYVKTCAVIELNIHPAKLSDPQLATEPDGSLFWKITTGKKPMPGFGKRLSETDRWHLVNYIRTLSKR